MLRQFIIPVYYPHTSHDTIKTVYGIQRDEKVRVYPITWKWFTLYPLTSTLLVLAVIE